MISVDGLKKTYNKRLVVNDVTFEINKGEIVGLLGPNGAGKTTTFYMIIGLVKPEEGKIIYNKAPITHLPMHKRAKMGIGYLPQESSIFKKLTVEENIYIIWELLNHIPKEDYESKLLELLDEMSLTHLRYAKGIELSGGEKRRVEIIRALATQPDFILLDEPFAGIDPLAVIEIQHIIETLKQKGLGIIITDHNVRETLKITDRAYIMHEGKILVSGQSNDIVTNKLAKELYLGESFSL